MNGEKNIGWRAYLQDFDRQTAFENFLKMPLPNLKYGITMNTNVSFLDFDKIIQDYDENEKTIVIEADQNVVVEEMKKETSAEFLKGFEEDKFLLLHEALCSQSIVVKIPDNTAHNVKISELAGNKNTFTSIFVVCGEHSQSKIIFEISSGNVYYRSSLVKITARQGSRVKVVHAQNAGEKTISFEKEIAVVEKDAELRFVDVCAGSCFTKRDLYAELKGEGASIQISGVNLGKREQVFDLHYSMIHSAKNTSSNMLMKGVLDEKAKCTLRGLVRIEKNCSGCKGYQKEDTLLLSESAQSDLLPKLEIDNDNVKCSHGSTVTHLDEEKMFYLMSRGLNESEAKRKIVEGFVSTVLDDEIEIKEKVMEKICT